MMEKRILQDPRVIQNYELLKDLGVIDYIDSINTDNKELEHLLSEAYEVFRKRSIEELVDYILECLSAKFIPSNLLFILNQGIMVNKIKVILYKNLKREESDLSIESLDPYEKFFRKYSNTTSFQIFESELSDTGLVETLQPYNPEIVVPVNGLSGLYGIIIFGSKVLAQEYSTKEISYINKLMKFTAIGIQNNIHYEYSVKDPKTDLYNHNFFIKRVEEEIARYKRSSKTFSVIMIDIDNFKRLNDKYGHLAGDEVIIKLSKKIRHEMREEDIISRFGGEEFTVLLPDADKNAALIAAERLRSAVEKMQTEWQELILKITVSIGVAAYDDKDAVGSILLDNADKAMYKSKEKGRNKVSIYNSDS